MIETTTSEYFAGVKPNQLCRELLGRIDEYYKYLSQSNRLVLWTRAYSYFNWSVYKDGRLNRIGEQGEYTEMTVNHYRNLLLHILNMVTGQKPTFEPRSTNSDFKSQAQTIVANGILEHYSRMPDSGIGVISKQATEDSLVLGDGYIYQGYDFSLGQPYMMGQDGRVIKTGDVVHKNFSPIDVIFDFVSGLLDSKRQWYILRDFQNKWDLIKQYPAMKDKIIAHSNSSDLWRYSYVRNRWNYQTDMVPVYIFMHDRTESMPEGRFFTFVGDDCWLVDTALPPFYKRLPVYRIFGTQQRNCGWGYTPAFDLLPIQEAIDGLYSTIITNQSTFGVQNIIMPSGSNISISELADGLNLLTYDPNLGKPEAMNLVQTPAEIFNFIEKLERVMETISGVNSVARGNPEASLKSGTALALVQSMALQFISGLQQSYATLIEDLGTGLINILKANANTPRMIEISGKNNKPYMKEFTSKDIDQIDRVTVDFGNPISRTTAGKVNMADNLLQAGLIENPQQYIQVLTTGKIEPLIEGKQAELMLIRNENESLSSGQQVQAIMTDNHPLHVIEHKCVLSSVDGRKDANVVTTTLSHIQEHIQLWKTADPALLQMIKEEVPPVNPMMGGDMGALQGNDKQLIAENPAVGEAKKVRMPNLPKNPLTQQRADLNIV